MIMDDVFGDWVKVVNKDILSVILQKLRSIPIEDLCPDPHNIFKAFTLCPYYDCKLVLISQDPYPQKGVATGIAFGNKTSKLSPSLKVIKESVINFAVPHNSITFDASLESWAKQGVLLLNSSLTCEVNKIGSHLQLWRPFIIDFLKAFSKAQPGMVYVLFGKEAQSLEKYIYKDNDIIHEYHPAYYVRTGKRMPHDLWKEIDNILIGKYGDTIEWYKEN